MLCASAHWKIEGGFLSKTYEFRDDKTAKLFAARASDLWPKLCCPAQELEVQGKSVSTHIKDASALGGDASEEGGDAPGMGRAPTAVEVDIALAVDDVAAELQLGGRWN